MTTAWPEVPLGEVAEFVRGITFKPADVEPLGTPGSIACMRTANVQAELDLEDVWAVPEQFCRRDDQRLRRGDLLVSTANSWNLVGKCAWVGDLPWPSTFGGFVSALRPASPDLDPRYLYRWFASPRIQATLRSYGRRTTSISNLSLDRCRAMRMPLPPVEEQRRIAAVLDRADELRAKRQASVAVLRVLEESVFLAMFGDPVTNDREWPMVPFAEVCPTRLGKMLDQKRQTGAHRRPYLRNANVRWFEFDLTDVAEMDFDSGDRAEFSVQPGDLLICEGGEPGRAAVWSGQVDEIYFQKALHRGRPDPSRVTAVYLVHLLWHLARRGGLLDHISSATIAHLTGARLKTMQIPVPDLAVQRQFEESLRQVGHQRDLVRRSEAELSALFASLQQRAFAGQL